MPNQLSIKMFILAAQNFASFNGLDRVLISLDDANLNFLIDSNRQPNV